MENEDGEGQEEVKVPKKRGWRFGQGNRHRKLIHSAIEQYLIETEDLKKNSELIEDLSVRFGVTTRAIYRHFAEFDWNYIKEERRKRFSSKISRVDDAVFRQAIKGDVNAAKLCYERFDGYVPTSRLLGIEKRSDEELQEMAKTIIQELNGQVEQKEGVGDNIEGTGQAQA